MRLPKREYATQLEIWRDVTGYEGLYQISNLGHLRNVKKGRLIKGNINTYFGYKQTSLSKDGTQKPVYFHRLVAVEFLVKPPNETYEVNHINCDKKDNRVENLEWVTHADNVAHYKRVKAAKKKE